MLYERDTRGACEAVCRQDGHFRPRADEQNQTARVFDAAVKEIPGKVTSLNEPYAQLTAQAYVPRNDGTKAFIESIESGIRKEVSVGCAVKKRVCSVCGAESCVHVPGKTYNGKRCVRILSGAADAYEFSFVAVPAQRGGRGKEIFAAL